MLLQTLNEDYNYINSSFFTVILIIMFCFDILLQIEAHTKVEEKKQLYAPYNILPLDPESGKEAIMRYPEVGSLLLCLDPFHLS